MKRILFFALLLSGTTSLFAARPTEYEKITDIPYRETGKDSYADSLCRLDIIYPKDQKGYSTMIWFHGGSLKGGTKSKVAGLAEKGFAVVSADYRLSPRVEVTDCIEDAAAAVAWVVRHIAEYGGDPKRLFIGGHSAGGYLTSMLGLDKRWLAPYGIDPDTTFVMLIPYSGQAITHFTRRWEMGMPRTQPLIDDLAPLYHVRPDCAPILILSGDRELELLGRYEENAYFWRMFQLVGHPNAKIYEFDGFSHGQMQVPGHLITTRLINDYDKQQATK